MRKVLLVATVQSHICQFHRPLVDLLHKQGFEVHVAARNNLDVKPGLKLDFVDKIYDIPFARSPLQANNWNAYRMIEKLLEKNEFEIIHCNTPIASVLTRIAAKKYRKKGIKVIYTAHGFQFYKGAAVKDWLLYFPIEYIMSFFTDLIITINREDKKRAEQFHTCKVAYIPGVGVDTSKFRCAQALDVHKEFGIPKNGYVILSVGELFPRKNHSFMLDVMKELKEFPIYYLICGNGILEKELREKCIQNQIEKRVIFGGYRRDIAQIMKGCDLFVFPSIREGLGLAGIEAMASGLPVVSSNLNGILDYMEDGKTGYICSPHRTKEFVDGIMKVYKNQELSMTISEYNINKAQEFDISKSVEALREAYLQVTNF